MHNIKDIRNDILSFKRSLKKRFLDFDTDKILKLDENNRKYILEKETLEKEKKDISKLKDKTLFEKSKIFLFRLKKLENYNLTLKMNFIVFYLLFPIFHTVMFQLVQMKIPI